MSYSTHTFTAKDGETIFYYRWKNVKPKGIVQIAHGIGEHAGRYQRISELLQENGYEVFANDHRIHGNSVKSKKHLGVYEGDNYFNDAISDMRKLTQIILQKFPKRKVILFGHSIGSLLSRQYVTKFGDDLQALILSGTGSYIKGLGSLGLTGANVAKFFKGRKRSSSILKKVFFNKFNKKFKLNRTQVDWISRDKEQVDLFANDPLRIQDFSISMFIDILKGSKKANTLDTFQTTPKDLPIYIFSGDKDPVGEMGEGVRKVANKYISAGINDLTFRLYKDGRHEMLNETNRKKVEKDFINWLNTKIKTKN